MVLREKLAAALKEASTLNDERAIRTLRLVRCALNERRFCDKESGRSDEIEDCDLEQMMAAMIAQRREQIGRYEEQGQLELARQEEEEIEIISRFLTPAMSEEDTAQAVDAALARTGAQKVKDLGRVLAELKAEFAGRMDFSRAKLILQQRLH